MALDAAARTHPGKVRTNNEDAWVCRANAGLFAVVDGMGGEASGEVASAIAVRAIAEVPGLPDIQSEAALSAAMKVARERILAEADADPAKEGMGAVATALRFDDDGKAITFAHVGDTRAYLIHAEGVRLLTHDHVSDGPAGTKRQVARDLGRRDIHAPFAEVGRTKVSTGDLLILCSDGLTDVVPTVELLAEFARLRGSQTAADAVATRLVALALDAGGPDNITVVAVRVGPYSRRRPVTFPWVSAAGLLVLAAAAWGMSLAVDQGVLDHWLVGDAAVDHLPATVDEFTEMLVGEDLMVGAASRTVLRAGASLRVVGKRITGSDWTLQVAPGAAVEFQRSVVAVDRDVLIELGAGAEALVRDLRIERGRLRIVVPTGSRVRIEHVFLATEESLVIEGSGAVIQTSVQLVKRAPHGNRSGP